MSMIRVEKLSKSFGHGGYRQGNGGQQHIEYVPVLEEGDPE